MLPQIFKPTVAERRQLAVIALGNDADIPGEEFFTSKIQGNNYFHYECKIFFMLQRVIF